MKPIVSLGLAAVALVIGAVGTHAEVPSSRVAVTPGIVNYQGRLMTPGGAVYSNGVYSIEFRIWDASSGGNVLWGGKYSAYVADGYFNVMLGATGGASVGDPQAPATVAVDELWKALWYDTGSGNNIERYLGIRVLNDPNGDPILPADASEAFPRQRMLCSPFAERAQMAQYARQSIDEFTVPGVLTASGEVRAEGGLNVTGGATVSGALNAGANSTFDNGLTVNGAVADLNKGLDVDGGAAVMRAGAEVTGLAQLKGGVTVTGNGQFNNNATVAGDLSVGDDASMDKLTLAGMGSTADAVIDHGGGFITYADNTGYGSANKRLWIGAPDNSEVDIGPRGGGQRLDRFYVKSDYSVFDGATVDFSSVSHINVEGDEPIHVRRFDMVNNTEDALHNTGYSASTWSALMVGFDWGYADIDENGSENTFSCRMEVHSGIWHVHFEGHYHENYADPIVDVMFIRRELVDDNRY